MCEIWDMFCSCRWHSHAHLHCFSSQSQLELRHNTVCAYLAPTSLHISFSPLLFYATSFTFSINPSISPYLSNCATLLISFSLLYVVFLHLVFSLSLSPFSLPHPLPPNNIFSSVYPQYTSSHIWLWKEKKASKCIFIEICLPPVVMERPN